jgi:Raf kinase inhibitor-like YbhB/YbcL family protein
MARQPLERKDDVGTNAVRRQRNRRREKTAMAEGTFSLSSPAFDPGAAVPKEYTCDGRDASPALRWENPPEGTRSYALIVDDPDAPDGTFTHWVLCDLPASMQSLPEGASQAGIEGRNDFGETGYGGPCPPPGHGTHRYRFRLFALDVDSLGLQNGAERQEVEEAMRGHVLDRTELAGEYAR